MSIVNRLTSSIPSSPTLAISEKAAQLKRDGHPIINLSVGEPDTLIPHDIREAAVTAIHRGDHLYTPVAGTPALRKAIAEKYAKELCMSFLSTENVLVSNGGKQVLYNALMASLEPKDEVIIPAPYWVSYPAITAYAGGVPVVVSCKEEFKISAQELEKAITPKTRWLVINSPSNPTGAVYTQEELRGIADVLLRHPRVWVLSDDIYEPLTYDVPFVSMLSVEPSLQERTLIVNGLSKAYAMTGWRLGYGIGPSELIAAMSNVQSQSTSGVSCITQAAALQAITQDHTVFLIEQRERFRARRALFTKALSKIKGLSYTQPQGAFYLFAECTAWMQEKGYTSDVALAQDILEKIYISCVPGTEFGMPGYLRFSYATGEEALQEAGLRLTEFYSQSAGGPRDHTGTLAS